MKSWDNPLNSKDRKLYQLHLIFLYKFIIFFWGVIAWIFVLNHLCLLPRKKDIEPHLMPCDLQGLPAVKLYFPAWMLGLPYGLPKPMKYEQKCNTCQFWAQALNACCISFTAFSFSFKNRLSQLGVVPLAWILEWEDRWSRTQPTVINT